MKKYFAYIVILIFFSFSANAQNSQSFAFIISQEKEAVFDALKSIPLFGDFIAANDIHNRIYVIKHTNDKAQIYTGDRIIELGKPKTKYKFKYSKKEITLNLSEGKVLSQSLLDDKELKELFIIPLLNTTEFDDEIKKLQDELTKSENQINQLSKTNDKLVKQLSDSETTKVAKNDLLSEQLRSTIAENSKLKAQLSILNDNLTKQSDNSIILRSNLKNKDKDLLNLTKKIKQIESELSLKNKAVSENKKLKSQLQEKNQEITKLNDLTNSLENSVKNLERSNSELENTKSAFNSLKSETTKKDQVIKTLKEQVASLINEKEQIVAGNKTEINKLIEKIKKLEGLQLQLENNKMQSEVSTEETSSDTNTVKIEDDNKAEVQLDSEDSKYFVKLFTECTKSNSEEGCNELTEFLSVKTEDPKMSLECKEKFTDMQLSIFQVVIDFNQLDQINFNQENIINCLSN